MLGRDVFCELIVGMAPILALCLLSMYSALDSGNDPEVVDRLVGEAVFLVSKVETFITGAVLPVDAVDHNGGGVPCQT